MKTSVVVTASCRMGDWAAGPVPGSEWDLIDKAAAKHVKPGHAVTTLAVPACPVRRDREGR